MFKNFLPRCKDLFSAVCTFQILLLEALTTGLMTKESNIPSPLNCGIKADTALPFLNPRFGQPAKRQCWRSSTLPTTSWSIHTSQTSENLSPKCSLFLFYPEFSFLLAWIFPDPNSSFKLLGLLN